MRQHLSKSIVLYNSRTWGEGKQDEGVQENVLNGQSVCLCSSSGGARKCTQWPECVSVFFFRGCKKMHSMARVCVCSSSGGARKCTQWPECVCVSTPLQGVQENVLNGQCVCLCLGVYSSSGGARKCTQWPVCVCVSIPLQGVQENVLKGQCVSVSVCLFLFRGCKKMYSMASVCLCLCVYSSSGGARKCTQWPVCVSLCVCMSIPLQVVQENVLNGQSVCLCVYSSSGDARKCTKWPACVCLSTCVCIYSSSGVARKCTQWPVCVSLSVSIPLQGVQKNVLNGQHVCVSVSACLCAYSSSGFHICHAKLNGQVLPWQSQQSTAGTPCPIASPTNVQACLSMFGAWVPMSVPYDIKNVITFCERVYPHHRNACVFSFVAVGIKYQILKA